MTIWVPLATIGSSRSAAQRHDVRSADCTTSGERAVDAVTADVNQQAELPRQRLGIERSWHGHFPRLPLRKPSFFWRFPAVPGTVGPLRLIQVSPRAVEARRL